MPAPSQFVPYSPTYPQREVSCTSEFLCRILPTRLYGLRLFTYLNTYLLSTYQVPDTVLGTGAEESTKETKICALLSLDSSKENI